MARLSDITVPVADATNAVESATAARLVAEGVSVIARRTNRVRLLGRCGGSIVRFPRSVARAPGAAVFSATGWGLRGLTRSVAGELGPRGIRVNMVCSATELIRSDELQGGALADGARIRATSPGDLAAMIAVLLNDDSTT